MGCSSWGRDANGVAGVRNARWVGGVSYPCACGASTALALPFEEGPGAIPARRRAAAASASRSGTSSSSRGVSSSDSISAATGLGGPGHLLARKSLVGGTRMASWFVMPQQIRPYGTGQRWELDCVVDVVQPKWWCEEATRHNGCTPDRTLHAMVARLCLVGRWGSGRGAGHVTLGRYGHRRVTVHWRETEVLLVQSAHGVRRTFSILPSTGSCLCCRLAGNRSCPPAEVLVRDGGGSTLGGQGRRGGKWDSSVVVQASCGGSESEVRARTRAFLGSRWVHRCCAPVRPVLPLLMYPHGRPSPRDK